ncbi:Ctr copper transporter [Bombardia bombarda]|uniref:Copper transport protein n=1 Tax=Bombardia bombarda TaxID=252184 RepID=A0AA39X6T2_9PEZI|nr:Ctr copper transporter [Bombardia bombarda]
MDMGNGSGGGECQISMLWNWYTIDSCFLASGWHNRSQGAFAASCIGVILMVVALEAIRRLGKMYDERILRQFRRKAAQARHSKAAEAHNPAYNSTSDIGNPGTGTKNVTPPPQPPMQHIMVGGDSAAAERGEGSLSNSATAVTFRADPGQQLLRALIHAMTFGLAYLIMLLAMSYNGYIIICIIIGAFLGKFLCDWMSQTVVIGGDSPREKFAEGIEEPTVCCG